MLEPDHRTTRSSAPTTPSEAVPVSHHPARRARTVTAVISAAAFAGIAGGLAADHAGASPARASTRGSTAVSPAPSATDQTGQSQPDNGLPTQGGWSATPGQDIGPVQDHGTSGAS
jgi:hypothetical protein